MTRSRDPLEGVRPDRFAPADMRPDDALDRPIVPSSARVALPGRSSRAMVAMLIGVLCAVAAGVMAFFLTEERRSSPVPQPAPTVQPSGNTAGDVVQQGAAPSTAK